MNIIVITLMLYAFRALRLINRLSLSPVPDLNTDLESCSNALLTLEANLAAHALRDLFANRESKPNTIKQQFSKLVEDVLLLVLCHPFARVLHFYHNDLAGDRRPVGVYQTVSQGWAFLVAPTSHGSETFVYKA